MPNKKIAVLGSRGIPANYGGFETFAEELATRLADKGIDVTVYCEIGPNSIIPFSQYKSIKLQYIASLALGPLSTIWYDLKCLWHARNKFDIVYMLGYGASIFCFVPRIWKTQVILNMDGIEWKRAKWGIIAKLWLKAMEAVSMCTANRLIADANGILNHLRSRHKKMPPCSVIPYGAPVIDIAPSTDLLKRLNLIPNQYYLTVCRLEPENHVWEILQGFSASTSVYPLIVIGNYLKKSDYVSRLLNIRDNRIRFIGPIYDKLSLRTLRYYTLGYFHGHSVGGTNPSLLEALGCGNIVIAHDNMFNREVAGYTAVYFKDARDIPDILSTIALYSEDQRKKHSDKAKDRIRDKFNWDLIIDQYLALFNA